ncbi:hypothetical protein MVEN_00836800 [Mycena venus]|uniref:F-box domain-containing protein n=1 Tax=Mycena venus TaxID=2733690 RepID=A0A8H6YH62_9AGAR|nr:hypothetical protein MVEN_00836800 [Mycena venus]
MRKALDKLSEERDALSAYVEAHEALVSPIRRLPLDILEEIFMACLPDRNCVMSAQEAPVILGRICSSWRTISLSTPRLWSRLHIVEPMGYISLNTSQRLQRLEVAKSWLRRSGDCPLSISLEGNPDAYIPPPSGTIVTSAEQDLFLDGLVQFASRWRNIRLVAPQLALAPLSRLTEQDVPLLEQLDIVCSTPEDPQHTSDAGWSLAQSGVFHGPSLSTFSISGNTSKASELPLRWNQLTTLSLFGALNSELAPSSSRVLRREIR